MKRIVVTEKGLHLASTGPLSPKPHEVLVTVKASGINRADLLQIQGKYPPPPGVTDTPGLEVSGAILSVGSDVSQWKEGDRVMALLAGGGFATHAVVSAGHLLPLPEGWSFEEGAAFPEAFITAFLNLVLEGEVEPGMRVLIHSGASGVGVAALQLLKHRGVTVSSTVGSLGKRNFLLERGADSVANYREDDFQGVFEERFGKRPFQRILDTVGGPYLGKNIGLLASTGRLISLACMGGVAGELFFPALLKYRLRIQGSVLRSRSDEEKTEIVRSLQQEYSLSCIENNFRPYLHHIGSLSNLDEAFDILRQSKNIGKVVVTVQ